MAKQFTGIDGALFANGTRVAKVSAWSFEATAEALDTTTLGDYARTAVYGIQSFTGNCTIFYYEQDGAVIDGTDLLSDVLRTTQTPTEPTHELELRYQNGATPRVVKFRCLLNTVSISATAGEIVTAEVGFQVTGPLQTATFA